MLAGHFFLKQVIIGNTGNQDHVIGYFAFIPKYLIRLPIFQASKKNGDSTSRKYPDFLLILILGLLIESIRTFSNHDNVRSTSCFWMLPQRSHGDYFISKKRALVGSQQNIKVS